MKAFLAGRRIAFFATFLVAMGLWAYSALKHALNFSEVEAVVERVEEVCRPVGEPVEAANAARCAEASAAARGRWWREQAVHVRYVSPADGETHVGVVVPQGGQAAVEAVRLRAGERWKVLAHDREPLVVRAR